MAVHHVAVGLKGGREALRLYGIEVSATEQDVNMWRPSRLQKSGARGKAAGVPELACEDLLQGCRQLCDSSHSICGRLIGLVGLCGFCRPAHTAPHFSKCRAEVHRRNLKEPALSPAVLRPVISLHQICPLLRGEEPEGESWVPRFVTIRPLLWSFSCKITMARGQAKTHKTSIQHLDTLLQIQDKVSPGSQRCWAERFGRRSITNSNLCHDTARAHACKTRAAHRIGAVSPQGFCLCLIFATMQLFLGQALPGKALATQTCRRGHARGSTAVVAGFGEDIRRALDAMAFENWAPRSSRAWRLGGDSRRADATAGPCPSCCSTTLCVLYSYLNDKSVLDLCQLLSMLHPQALLRGPWRTPSMRSPSTS
jgi:hypothetical protein